MNEKLMTEQDLLDFGIQETLNMLVKKGYEIDSYMSKIGTYPNIVARKDGKLYGFLVEEYKFISSAEEYNATIEECFSYENTKFDENYDENLIEDDLEFFKNNKILFLCINDKSLYIQSIKENNKDINIIITEKKGALPEETFVCLIPVSKNIENVSISYSDSVIVRNMVIIINTLKISAVWLTLCFIYALIKRNGGWKKIIITDLIIFLLFKILHYILIRVTYYSP